MSAKMCRVSKEQIKWFFGCIPCGEINKCKYEIKFGKVGYCGYCPARCGLHEVIKSQKGCMWCIHYTKDLKSKVCMECLEHYENINFKRESVKI